MQWALEEAQQAALSGEVPVGAVILDSRGKVLSKAHNHVERNFDASAHAEMLALRQAAIVQNSPRLVDCTIVVTLEPCPMCAAAMSHFRIGRLIYGAYDPKGGGVDHGARLFQQPSCLHCPEEIISGVREQEAALLLRRFFQERRIK
ncbi:nucleoside deaminase [Saccharibacter sp. 17.LH.SD]|nr:nucleoside deaminase [Saccharibacter sp. 17.LH.SD]